MGASNAPLIEADLARVPVYVYDGDNVRLKNERLTFRLVGVNAPEIRGKCETEKVAARKARDRLRQLVKDPSAKLTEVLCYGSNFGRRCGVVKVRGVDVAATLVREGLADPYLCGSQGCPKRREWCP
jgi:endonuclease YncB( thermonuclease family)